MPRENKKNRLLVSHGVIIEMAATATWGRFRVSVPAELLVRPIVSGLNDGEAAKRLGSDALLPPPNVELPAALELMRVKEML